MMDGPWQEVIYNLSLPCVSVRQLRQTERDKERQKQKDAHRQRAMKEMMKLFFYFREIFIITQVCCSIAAPGEAAGDALHF